MSGNFIFYFILSIIISILKASEVSKNEDDSNQSNINSNSNDASNKRKLQSFEPIRIGKDYLSNFIRLVDPLTEYDIVNESIEKALNYIQELVSVRRLTSPITILQSDNQDGLLNSFINNQYHADLVIFFNANYKMASDEDISTINIIRKLDDNNNPNNGRPIIALLNYNLRFLNVYLKGATDEAKKKVLTFRFMHEFFHFLGFERSILSEKRILDTTTIRRVGSISKSKSIAKGRIMLQKARNYFDCQSLVGLEFEADEQFLHWDNRLLLGDIMTSNVYYPDQVISEFTLALLEDIGWYKVNYYTGGLMRFGKHKGCNFISY